MKTCLGVPGLSQDSWQTLTMLLIVRGSRLSRSPLRCSPTETKRGFPLRVASPRGRFLMSIVRPIWLNLAILAAIGLQADVVFAQVFNGLQRQGDTSSSAQGPHYFTIMGHVAQPNCYELPTASPSLVGFAQLAGDLTRTAGGPIHIVRDGRIVQSTFYSNKSTLRLVPGDIVVVDGKVNQGRIIHRGNQAPSDSNGGDVSLAITGLRDYAIVLNIPADRATIRWVTRHLGLDAGVASHVKATTPRPSSTTLNSNATGSPSASVNWKLDGATCRAAPRLNTTGALGATSFWSSNG